MTLAALSQALNVVLFCVLCRAQQSPFFDTPKFADAEHRTDMCKRARLLFADEIELPDALQGLDLSVVLTNYKDPGSTPFFTLVDGVIDENNPGLFALLMDEMAERAGFSWRDTYGVVDPIDAEVDGNRTWTDLLEWEVHTYDISMGKWDHSSDRMKREISFPEGWYDASTIVVESITDQFEDKSLNYWSFLLPFTWGVWLLIILTVIGTGLMYYFLEKLNSAADERDLEHQAGAAVFYSAITMTGHYEFRPQTHAARLLTFSLTLFALIVVAVYTANLVSFLVIRRTPVFEIESVKQAVLLRAPICVESKVQTDEYLTTTYPDAILVRKATPSDVFGALQNDECQIAAVPVSLFDVYQRNLDVNEDCSLSWQGRTEKIVPSGIATAVDTGILCSSLISYVLDFHLTQMKADGFLDRLWEEHLQKITDHDCDSSSSLATAAGGSGVGDASAEDETYSLSASELAGVFIIHVILATLAILMAIWSFWRTDKCRGPAEMSDEDLREERVAKPKGSLQDFEGSSDTDVTGSVTELRNGGHSDKEEGEC
jgi:hypothetical protein